jgi:cerevisin
LAACSAGLAPVFNTNRATIIPGEYLVSLKTGTVGLASVYSNMQVLNTFNIHGWTALHVKVEDSDFLALQGDANVDFIEANTMEWSVDCTEQSTTDEIWGLTRTSSRDLPDYTTGVYMYDVDDGTGVDAYIVDTGIYIGHNDFGDRATHGFTAPGINEGDDDLHGHGTHCAGTTGGTVYGVAKNVNLIAVKVLNRNGAGLTSDIVAGVDYVTASHEASTSKKTTMNMSLGSAFPSPAMETAVQNAINAGVHAVVAAGNSNADACTFSPARVEDALTVAASDINDDMASFTNYGTCVDMIAPGVDVLSAYIGDPDASRTMSGTSMAAPHICGWVARYLSTFEDGQGPTPIEMKDQLADLGTWDAINLVPPKDTTPNLLIYSACD